MNLIYKTDDGREFTDETAAQYHSALLDRIDAHLDANGVGETRRKKLREMFVAWEAQKPVVGDK